jgi:hypothetical protein
MILVFSFCSVAVLLYAINYCFTPKLVGDVELERFFRPRYAMQFDTIVWKHSKMRDRIRYDMVDSLIESVLIHSMTERQITNLLGIPDYYQIHPVEKHLFYELARQKDRPSRSWLFPNKFWNFDCWSLDITLTNGVFHNASIAF